MDKDGEIDAQDLVKLCKKNSTTGSNYEDVLRFCREVCGTEGATMETFMTVMSKLTARKASSPKDSPDTTPKKQITRIAGATGSSQHSIDEEELEQFALHINQVLHSDSDIGHRMPIEATKLFGACQDGLVLSKLINDAVPETIDERVLNFGDKLNLFQMTENNNLVINSAKAIGCSVVNIGSQDLIEGEKHLVLGLVWQVIKAGLLSKINLQYHPELYRLLEAGETIERLLSLPADELLFRWFNYHLKGSRMEAEEVTNFSSLTFVNLENYTVLLNQLFPTDCSRDALREGDVEKRAEMVFDNAAKIGCRKYVSVKAIVMEIPS